MNSDAIGYTVFPALCMISGMFQTSLDSALIAVDKLTLSLVLVWDSVCYLKWVKAVENVRFQHKRRVYGGLGQWVYVLARTVVLQVWCLDQQCQHSLRIY